MGTFLQRAGHEDVDTGVSCNELSIQLLVELFLAIGFKFNFDAGFFFKIRQERHDCIGPCVIRKDQSDRCPLIRLVLRCYRKR